ncbi:iron complex transport system ATP-binding protein [Poseidonocella pacifica]|uniref:Iron complex transport system ATP-binding protein n=1 Tax=Poseidonocella pacifica TaxID=871651 RepID=A0A1I0WRM9_9RHOB|nr:ABC transporter ATP-binding protein [Poseidonocella pacifica]SFA91415.1 iron complex transport system ATP-binding protein [Poseidonocella pacifica]
MIKVEGLSKNAGAVEILKDLTLSIPPGGITALIGPNGAGKSSLLHCIAGLDRPTSGMVRIDGTDPFSCPDRERARHLAFLQQSQPVVPRLTVRDMVAFGRWPHHGGRPRPEDAEATEQALRAFELEDLSERPLEVLSGGQRQRALVAMTYAQATPWLLLDEPLNALDPRHAHDLMRRLNDLSHAADERSVVVVLHDINAAARWADRIIAMKDGRIAAEGLVAEVLTGEVLRDLYDTPFDVLVHGGRPLVVTV